MSGNCLKIANSQAFWGDTPTASGRLVQQQSDLDYLTLDYLSELSMSILAIQREKNPTMGYASDFLDVILTLIPHWQSGSKVRVISNAGGLNPLACAKACKKALIENNCGHIRIGILDGDDVLQVLLNDPAQPLYRNIETNQSLSTISKNLVTANAYLGANGIVDLLKLGADIIITGRIADPSMVVAPAVFHHKWNFKDYDCLAQATVAGHLIECGTQVSGGFSTVWMSISKPAKIGFPIVEIAADGTFVVTKPEVSSGIVNMRTVKEQLLYEIGDPARYLSPDVTASFLSIDLKDVGANRIQVSGASGKPPPQNYKVSASYRAGYKAEAMLIIFGQNAEEKAKRCGALVQERVTYAGHNLDDFLVECFGGGAPAGYNITNNNSIECVVRFAAASSNKSAIEAFAKEIAPLITSGPQGIYGYTAGRPTVRQTFGYWPCLIKRDSVFPKIQII